MRITAQTTAAELADEIAAAISELHVYRDRPDSIAFRSEADALERAYTAREQRHQLAPVGRPVDVTLLHAVAYDRPTDPDIVRPLPAGYSLDRLTIVRADQVNAGDLVVGDVDQPVTRGGTLRYATYIRAPYVAQPTPYDPECWKCRQWFGTGPDGPAVCLTPHNPEDADTLVAIVPAPVPVPAGPEACVHACTCEKGFLRQTTRSFYPPAVCGNCHRRPCAACAEAGGSTH